MKSYSPSITRCRCFLRVCGINSCAPVSTDNDVNKEYCLLSHFTAQFLFQTLTVRNTSAMRNDLLGIVSPSCVQCRRSFLAVDFGLSFHLYLRITCSERLNNLDLCNLGTQVESDNFCSSIFINGGSASLDKIKSLRSLW